MALMPTIERTDSRTPAFATDDDRWLAVSRRDTAADGTFFYSVASTGVFCRPSCASRPARRENVAFHESVAAARRAGFRPCLRCRPDLPSRGQREADLITAACRTIEAAEEPPSLHDLAAGAGLSPYHFHRLFRRVTGVTPAAYARTHRHHAVEQILRSGSQVTDAIYEAGFGSPSRFYEAAPSLLGMTPSRYRKGAPGERIDYAVERCSLGFVLVARTEFGVCAIMLGDEAEALERELRGRFSLADVGVAGSEFAGLMREVVRLVDDPAAAPALSLPLDIRGTAFQRRVWEVLRTIPAGDTASYGEVARRLGQPAASRAVAAACAANQLAVAIPCHRVVGSGGATGGYRWGAARKRKLLTREATTTAV